MYSEMNNKVIKVCCFGRFYVEWINNQNLKLNFRTKKAKELFAFLFHLQGNPVERRYILERMWPDKSPDSAISAFHCAIYSIRKAFFEMGIMDIILHVDRKYSMNMHYIDSELDYFQLIIKEMENKNTKFIEKHRKFFLEYQGCYMYTISGDWYFEPAEFYDRMFLKGCRISAKIEMKNKNYDEAVQYIKQGIKIDEFSESLYAMMIFAYGKKREFKNMRDCKKRIEKLLRDELGIEKSSIICHAYESIQNELIGIP